MGKLNVICSPSTKHFISISVILVRSSKCRIEDFAFVYHRKDFQVSQIIRKWEISRSLSVIVAVSIRNLLLHSFRRGSVAWWYSITRWRNTTSDCLIWAAASTPSFQFLAVLILISEKNIAHFSFPFVKLLIIGSYVLYGLRHSARTVSKTARLSIEFPVAKAIQTT